MEQRRGIIPFSCASTILLSIYFPPFSFPGSREDPNSRESPLTSSLLSPSPPPSFAFSRSPFSAFSLALLLRVSLRFFQSEPSSPPLTFVDGACPRRRPPSASSPVAASAHFHHPLRPLRIASLPVPFVLTIQPLSFSLFFSTIAVHLFLRLFLHRLFVLFLSFLALFDCYTLTPHRPSAVVIIKHCESQR